MSKCYKCGKQWTNENKIETPAFCPECLVDRQQRMTPPPSSAVRAAHQIILFPYISKNQSDWPDELADIILDTTPLAEGIELARMVLKQHEDIRLAFGWTDHKHECNLCTQARLVLAKEEGK